jgi:hypothetical protein
MRKVIGVLLAGLLVSCGSMELAEGEQNVTGFPLPPCQQACHNASHYCTATPEECKAQQLACMEACLTGGVRADVATESGGAQVTQAALTYCYIMESRQCVAQGAKILCTPDGYSTATCYCQLGWWDCPPYENGPVGD